MLVCAAAIRFILHFIGIHLYYWQRYEIGRGGMWSKFIAASVVLCIEGRSSKELDVELYEQGRWHGEGIP